MYRLGIVYIMRDDSLTEVFNLRGVEFDISGETLNPTEDKCVKNIQYQNQSALAANYNYW